MSELRDILSDFLDANRMTIEDFVRKAKSMNIDIGLPIMYRVLAGRNYHIRTRQNIEKVMSSKSTSAPQKENDNIDVDIIQQLLEQIKEQTDIIKELQRHNAELYKKNAELYKQLAERDRHQINKNIS